MEAETEVMTPQLQAQEAKRNKEWSLQRESTPDLDLGSEKLILNIQSLELWENIFFLILSHQVYTTCYSRHRKLL